MMVRWAVIASTALLGIVAAQAADAPASGTLVPGMLVPGLPATGTPAPPNPPAPGAPAPETAAPATPGPGAAAPQTTVPERAAPKSPNPRKTVRHRPAPRKEPAAEEAEKPGAVEEAARTCIHNRLKALIEEDQRGDIAADAALNACTQGLKAEFKAKNKSYCEAVAYTGWLVSDENSKLNGVQAQPYQPNMAFIQDCAKTQSWEKHR